MKHTRASGSALALVAAALATVLFACCIGLGIGGAGTTRWVDCSLTAAAAGIACVTCLHACSRHEGRLRTFWALLACAALTWTIGELIWGYDSVVRRDAVIPSPSLADVAFLAAIPLTVAALVVHPATTASLERKTRWLLDGLVAATALLFLSWTLVLGPTLAEPASGPCLGS